MLTLWLFACTPDQDDGQVPLPTSPPPSTPPVATTPPITPSTPAVACDPGDAALIGAVAYTSLQEALDAAVDGDVVLVCDGRHSTTGFVDDAITVASASGSRDAVVVTGVGPLFTVDGGALTLVSLTLEGATDRAVTALTPGGGPVTIDDCVLRDNSSTGNGGAVAGTFVTITGSELTENAAPNGGAVYAEAPGSLTITDSTVSDNDSDVAGAGLYATTPVTLSNVVLENNVNGHLGGGAYVETAGDVIVLTGVTFRANESGDGGGLMAVDTSVTADAATLFEANLAIWTGGGVFVQSNVGLVTWSGGQVVGNQQLSDEELGGGGGAFRGVASTGGSVAVSDLDVMDNRSFSRGAGLRLDGAVSLTDVWIEGNRGEEDGGGLVLDSEPEMRFERVTVVGNSAARGGGFDIPGSTFTVEWIDSVIEGNKADDWGGAASLGLYPPAVGVLVVTTTDFGHGATDNKPEDVFVDFGALDTANGRLETGETFVCDSTTHTCTF